MFYLLLLLFLLYHYEIPGIFNSIACSKILHHAPPCAKSISSPAKTLDILFESIEKYFVIFFIQKTPAKMEPSGIVS